jgi:hypothetical protein
VSEPILVGIAAALAGSAASSLYDFVKSRFSRRPQGTAALEAARGASPDSVEVLALATELARAEQDDPEFGIELRSRWAAFSTQQEASHGGVANQVSGDVSGSVVQARDIEGGVRF